MPSRCLSEMWTGMFFYACTISIFARKHPSLSSIMMWAASSTVECDMEQRDGSIPELTIADGGNDRSRIRCHLFRCDCLGITPKQLICSELMLSIGRGPMIWSAWHSFSKYSSTGPEFSIADGIFRVVG